MPFEWFMLLLRIVFIFLLYFFVFQVIRVLSREMKHAAGAAQVQGRQGPAAPYGALRVEEGGESNLYPGQMLALDPVSVIGRDRKATISIDHSFVSAEHTQISWEGGQWWASDLRSTNGTYVNGSRINVSTALQPGDQIQIGDVALRLVQ
jgi:hypothetical protein